MGSGPGSSGPHLIIGQMEAYRAGKNYYNRASLLCKGIRDWMSWHPTPESELNPSLERYCYYVQYRNDNNNDNKAF